MIFSHQLDTGVIILAAMTCGIRNNWVAAINKAIKTALEDSGKKAASDESSSLKENQPEIKEKTSTKPNFLLVSKSATEVRPKEEKSSPLQPILKSINNADLIPTSKSITQTNSKATHSPVESKAFVERPSNTQPTRTSPIESLPSHSGKPEGRRSSISKGSSTSESRPQRASVTKESTSSEVRRNSVSKEPVITETKQKHSASPKDSSGSDTTKSGKSKERRSRRGARTEKRSQEESAAAVTAVLSKRTSNMSSDQKQSTSVRKLSSNSPTEETSKHAVNSKQLSHRSMASNSERKKQSASGDATVIALLEQEVSFL